MESFMGRHQIGIDGEDEAKQRRRIGIENKGLFDLVSKNCILVFKNVKTRNLFD
jgi:sulfatase maturation enzyme AslB (radical SAM superfamily)